MKKKQANLKLFPNYFKKIAFGLLAFSILILVLNKNSILGFDKELIKELLKVGILVSLSMLALTKDKEEDELTIKIRMNSYASSFLFGVIFYIVQPFMNLLFGKPFLFDMDAFQLIITMLFVYFLSFFSSKKNR
ncbi:MAG: hypothetical protein GX677_03180 [Treponema sp.]|jgi:hypothetical protein|nr:hypothetical protein [Treponema sp.]